MDAANPCFEQADRELAAGRYEQAIRLYESCPVDDSIVSVFSRSFGLGCCHFDLFLEHWELGDLLKAIEHLCEARETYEPHCDVYMMLAQSYATLWAVDGLIRFKTDARTAYTRAYDLAERRPEGSPSELRARILELLVELDEIKPGSVRLIPTE